MTWWPRPWSLTEDLSGPVRTTTETCSLMLWLRVSISTYTHTSHAVHSLPFSFSLSSFGNAVWLLWISSHWYLDCCVSLLRLRLSGYDDQRAGVSGWTHRGGWSRSRHSHPALSPTPAGKRDVHQPHRWDTHTRAFMQKHTHTLYIQNVLLFDMHSKCIHRHFYIGLWPVI